MYLLVAIIIVVVVYLVVRIKGKIGGK